jgi:hypothetical protein
MAEIKRMISETRKWKTFHMDRDAHIEAAACAIREAALKDALRAIQKDRHG